MNTLPADFPSSWKLCVHQLGAQVMSQLIVLLLKCEEQILSLTQHIHKNPQKIRQGSNLIWEEKLYKVLSRGGWGYVPQEKCGI